MTSLDNRSSSTQRDLICHTPCRCVVRVRGQQSVASKCVKVSLAASKVEVAEWHPS